MEQLTAIVKQIFYISILSTLLTGIMPHEKYQRVIKTICGLFLLMIMIQPLLKLFHGDQLLENIYDSLMQQQQLMEIQQTANMDNSEELIAACQEEIEKTIDALVLEEGMYPSNTKVVICEDWQDARYGTIERIYLNLSQQQGAEQKKGAIEIVQIDGITVTLSSKESQLQEAEKNYGIRDKISEYYKLEPNQIIIQSID